MPDDDKGTDNATDNGGATGTGDQAKDERAGWTVEQWQDFHQREADRRVTEAQKKWREDLAAQLTAKDQDAEQRISTVLEQAKQAETRAAFAELAHKAGIADIRAAWAVVKEYGLADDKGSVNFDTLKEAHPALFATQNKTTTAVRPVDDTKGSDGKINMTAVIRNEARKNVVAVG